MMIHNNIPILEYDDTQTAVIQPTHEKLSLQLPKKVIFAFLGEAIDTYANEHKAEIIGEFISITKKYPIYVIEYNGEKIGFCQAPAGAPAAVQIMDWLIGYGAKIILSAGSCGVLVDLPENAFLLPIKAIRDEGTSYHYLPPTRYVELDKDVLIAMERTLDTLRLPYSECVTWTTDGFFRETKDKVAKRKRDGCTVVEMECAALAACARFRNVKFGQLLFTADSLAGVESYDERNWGVDSIEKALHLCFAMIRNL